MPKKRKRPDDNLSFVSYNPNTKLIDQRGGDDASSAPQSKIDPTYGQRGAFPGLDDTSANDGLFYGPANDGLEYLRMVRHEAKYVPNLLVAPSPEKEQEGNLYADYPQGFYSDGAYTAAPVPSLTTAPHIGDPEDIDPQAAYYTSLLARFANLQSVLRSPTSTDHNNYTATLLMQNKRAVWRGKLLKTTPTMQTLSQIPQESIIYGLEVLGDLLTQTNLKNGKYGKNLGAWTWGLMGACREIGEMGSEEVGVLRSVGKQAVWLLRRVAAGEVDETEEAEDVVDGTFREEENSEHQNRAIEAYEEGRGEGGNFAEATAIIDPNSDDPVAVAQLRLLSSLNGNDTSQEEQPKKAKQDAADPNQSRTTVATASQMEILATLDMIVTIVGEVYEQRDLLDGRLLWDEIE